MDQTREHEWRNHMGFFFYWQNETVQWTEPA